MYKLKITNFTTPIMFILLTFQSLSLLLLIIYDKEIAKKHEISM